MNNPNKLEAHEVEELMKPYIDSNDYNEKQLEVIKKGIEHNINYKLYDNSDFAFDQMEAIYNALWNLYDVEPYIDLKFSPRKIFLLAELDKKSGDYDLKYLKDLALTSRELQILSENLFDEIDFNKVFIKPNMTEDEIRFHMEQNKIFYTYAEITTKTEEFAKKNIWTDEQLAAISRLIRLGFDLHKIKDIDLTTSQLFDISVAYEDNKNIDWLLMNKMSKMKFDFYLKLVRQYDDDFIKLVHQFDNMSDQDIANIQMILSGGYTLEEIFNENIESYRDVHDSIKYFSNIVIWDKAFHRIAVLKKWLAKFDEDHDWYNSAKIELDELLSDFPLDDNDSIIDAEIVEDWELKRLYYFED